MNFKQSKLAKLISSEFIKLNYLYKIILTFFIINMKITLERLNCIKQLHKNGEINQLVFEICYSSLEQIQEIEQALSYCEHNHISEGLYRVIEHRKSKVFGKKSKKDKDISLAVLNKNPPTNKQQQESSKNFFSFLNVFNFWGSSPNNQKKYRNIKNVEIQPITIHNYLSPQQMSNSQSKETNRSLFSEQFSLEQEQQTVQNKEFLQEDKRGQSD